MAASPLPVDTRGEPRWFGARHGEVAQRFAEMAAARTPEPAPEPGPMEAPVMLSAARVVRAMALMQRERTA